MIIATGEVRDGKPVLACSHCGVRFATSQPIEKCRCFCTPPTLRDLWHEYRKARKLYKDAGSPNVSRDEQSARLAVCAECPSQMLKSSSLGKVFDRCRGCGCFVALKSKWATEHCPMSHWANDPPHVETKCGGCQQKETQ